MWVTKRQILAAVELGAIDSHNNAFQILKKLSSIQHQLSAMNLKLGVIMATVKLEQESLDKFASDFNEAIDNVAAEIQALVDSSSNNLGTADVSGLNTALDKLRTLEPPTPVAPPEETV